MGECRLVLNEKEDFLTRNPQFGELDGESQAFVLGAFGLVELNPKTLIVFVRDGEASARLELRQILTPETSDKTIGVGEPLYSKCA